MLSQKQWISVRESAELLGISPGRIRQLLLQGRLEGAQKLTERSWAIPRATVLAFKKMDRPPGNPNFQK